MPWTVLYHDDFVPELEALPDDVQDALLASAALLATYGPALSRLMRIRWRARGTPI